MESHGGGIVMDGHLFSLLTWWLTLIIPVLFSGQPKWWFVIHVFEVLVKGNFCRDLH